ncbi:NADP-dependent oxidoreductase [Yinghuangia sp. YIM S10712]|uniref:NADP-dependent oxidoreductase n=1 Tax=Yinghuangia sp. YIM S10712 TaxID=3436930 RepID=UPI003F539F8F
MHAITQNRAGGPEVLNLVSAERPVPGAVEVLVKVHAAGVNPTDWKTRRRGRFRDGSRAPFILGHDVSGVVEAVGPGVTLFRPGDEVYGMVGFPHPAGAYAEYLTAPPRQLARKPRNLTHVEAAALPLASLTAWQALVDTADVRPGQRVLVHAAAGGVGHVAVQIAKARGAYVIGTASAGKHELLRGLGADEMVDYRAVDFAAAVSDVDVVLDSVGGDYAARSLRVLKRGGTLVTILPPDEDFPAQEAEAAGVRTEYMLVEPDRAGLEAVTDLVESGRLRVVVDEVFPLVAAAKAHELGERGGTTGKIVLSVVEG